MGIEIKHDTESIEILISHNHIAYTRPGFDIPVISQFQPNIDEDSVKDESVNKVSSITIII